MSLAHNGKVTLTALLANFYLNKSSRGLKCQVSFRALISDKFNERDLFKKLKSKQELRLFFHLIKGHSRLHNKLKIESTKTRHEGNYGEKGTSRVCSKGHLR